MPRSDFHSKEIPSYVEKKASVREIRDSGPSETSRMSVEVPTSGSLIKFAEKKNTLISNETKKEDDRNMSITKAKETLARSASGVNE